MVGAGGREWRLVKLIQGMMSREMWTFFYRGDLPNKSNDRDNTLKLSIEFDKLSLQSRIVRRGRGVGARYHIEVKG